MTLFQTPGSPVLRFRPVPQRSVSARLPCVAFQDGFPALCFRSVSQRCVSGPVLPRCVSGPVSQHCVSGRFSSIAFRLFQASSPVLCSGQVVGFPGLRFEPVPETLRFRPSSPTLRFRPVPSVAFRPGFPDRQESVPLHSRPSVKYSMTSAT